MRNAGLEEAQAGIKIARRNMEKAEKVWPEWRRIMEKAREFQKSIYFCFIDYAKAFDCVDHNKL